MPNDLTPHPRRIQFLTQVNTRLDAFELSLLNSGIPDASTRRQSVEAAFRSATEHMDEFELAAALPLLTRLMQRDIDGVEVHVVRVFVFNDGSRSEGCAQCPYASNFLSEGITAFDRLPHKFNTDSQGWPRFRKRHRVTKGKKLVVVQHETQSSGPTTQSSCTLSKKLGAVISAGECQLALKVSAAETQSDRESAVQALADASWGQDVGVRRDPHERLVGEAALNIAIDNLSASGFARATAPNSDHQAMLLAREIALHGEATDAVGYNPTYGAWEYITKTYADEVCERWKQYPLFFEDMGSKPDDRSLCRFRNAGRFEPGNVFWATKRQAAFERMRGK